MADMRVLVTGHRGMIGSVVSRHLAEAGHEVHGFDLADGHDVLDREALSPAVDGCDGVVHLAGIDAPRPAAEIVEVNAIGSQRVLEACLVWGVPRCVYASSVNALGVFKGEASPDYLPIDDLHPARPGTPYGSSKRAVERVAEMMSAEGRLTTICLRPPGVLDDEMVAEVRRRRQVEPASEYDPIWEYGAWLHVEDLAEAVAAALACPPPTGGHATVLLAAADVSSDRFSGPELAERLLPQVAWRGGPEFATDRWGSLVDTSRAQVLLGWEPTRRWPR